MLSADGVGLALWLSIPFYGAYVLFLSARAGTRLMLVSPWCLVGSRGMSR